jgi:hypothetical protein
MPNKEGIESTRFTKMLLANNNRLFLRCLHHHALSTATISSPSPKRLLMISTTFLLSFWHLAAVPSHEKFLIQLNPDPFY